jgi:competence ComEA-like helix-hairpin-helix protein
MRQGPQALNARFFLFLFLASLLAIASLSCVKLPRRFVYASDQAASSVSQTGSPLININTASTSELEKLPGIGRGIAARIISYRAEHGKFRRPEHLMMVRGISTRRFRAMQSLITAE